MFPQDFHARKLGESKEFYAVKELKKNYSSVAETSEVII